MALAYVRTLKLTVKSIQVLFNDNIDTDVGVGNVSVVSELFNIPNPEVRSISVENDVVTITFNALFPNIQYKITFASTSSQAFQTTNGERIFEDGNRNSFFVVSPGEAKNEIRDNMFDDISVLYETAEPTLVRDLTSSTAHQLQSASDAIETTKSANYLSVLVEDELKTRDDGPIDRLNKGGVFKVLRVATTPTSATKITHLEFNTQRAAQFKVRDNIIVNSVLETITGDPISLQAVDVINEKVTDNTSASNNFDGLYIKVTKNPVIQVISVSLKRNNVYTEYDIERFGYTLKDNRYDTASGSINVNLSNSEIELSSSSIIGTSGGFLVPRVGDEIYISYVYKKLGRDVDSGSVAVTRIRSVVREVVPAVTNQFTLEKAPIVTKLDEVAVSGGVSFLNTQASGGKLAFTTTHPAFVKELPYDIIKLPARVGEYTINYENGNVLVYGEDVDNKGTGDNNPVADYSYRQSFVSTIDFTFSSDTDEIAANSTRDLVGIEAKITFNYEDTFAKDTDYRLLTHVEVLDERINNKLISDFTIATEYFPITNVFRIFNETTGELYTPERFNDTSITFTGARVPRQLDINRERALFSRTPQEVLLISDELKNSNDLRIYKIELANSGITNEQGRHIGANFDTSILFSSTDLFIREFFYEDRLFQNVDTNIDRLKTIGDYTINYTNGIVYVVVATTQGTDLGDITYRYKKIETINKHILGVNNIYRSKNALLANVTIYNIGTITDETVNIVNLEQSGERFVNNNITRTLVIGTHQSGEDGLTLVDSNVFTSFSAIFTSADVGRTLRVGSSSNPPVQEVEITSIINNREVTVTPVFNYTKKGRVWTILDLSTGAPKTITLDHDIISVKEIYTVTQLGSLPFSELDGYFDIDNDIVSGNVITLNSENELTIGEAIIVIYNSGDLFIDYRYLQDKIVISYEYGNNSLDWSISSVLKTNDEYYVTYRYGALRESLLLNFGSLTQISQLTNFSPKFDREVYRSVVGGILQSFIEGPTITSLERLVESFTDITPEISETIFDNWVLGRDNLHLRKPIYNTDQTFGFGKFSNGVSVNEGQSVQITALSHFRLDEGTLEIWIRPEWSGTANDSTLTFDLFIDGYSDPAKVFIGFAGENPNKIPFSLSVKDSDISAIGEPTNIDEDVGFFIWFNEFDDKWNLRWREDISKLSNFNGSISTSGEFYNVIKPIGPDGYEINEITDIITSTISSIDFTAFIDGYDEATTTGIFSIDGISFMSDDSHYIFDMAEKSVANRVSLFRDGTGYLNFQVFDNRTNLGLSAGFYNISKNIRDWTANELHHIAIAWKFNSSDEKDEMHMFIDGEEVINLFKYGGNPKASVSFDFGDIAEEIIINNSIKPIIGAFDGLTESGLSVFRSESADFSNAGVQVGYIFYLLDDTADGTGDPNFSLPYTITGVGTTTLTLDRAPTLTLGNLHYSVGSTTITVTTPINIQDFIIISVDADGNETELYGVDTSYPDYSVRRGSDNTHVITINNRVSLSDDVIIRPLGLILKRCRERVYVYGGGYDEIRLNAATPVSLTDVKITEIILDKTLISADGVFDLVGTVIDSQLVTILQATFDSTIDGYLDVCQPSNQIAGKKLSVKLSGDSFNYEISGNKIIIYGRTYSGITEETILFTSNSTIVTNEYWIQIYSVLVSVIPVDASQAPGTVEIKEYKPITVSENNGDFAEVVEYSNGIIRLEIYGTGGQSFILNECTYEIDYPSYLRIRIDAQPDTFYIGSDYAGSNKFDGILDEFRILDYMSEDTRIGETLESGARSITTDYNESQMFIKNSNTLSLMHFNDNTEDVSTFIDRFDKGFEVATSVNDKFGTAIKFAKNKPYIINNAGPIFNKDEGTIELWLSPLDDSRGDPNYHYYIDMSSVIEEIAESASSLTVVSVSRIREVESVRLFTDIYNTGTNYFTGGSVSNIDYKSIILGIPLPAQNVQVKIVYVPLSNQGDQVSLFRDPNGRINFFVKASGIEHLISVPMSWTRNTWHRIMIMWKMNSTDNQDRLRLFVDGSERGTIRYGTGLIYGTGIIYGQAEIRPGVNRFLVDNIDLTDTFARIYLGSDVFGINGARALLDNIRFSSVQRLNTIKITSNDTIDINYIANTKFAIPVVSDLNTTAIYNFDTISSDIQYLTTIINAERGIFRFKVKVIDSFNKVIGNTELESLLINLINIIKPAHCESIIIFEK